MKDHNTVEIVSVLKSWEVWHLGKICFESERLADAIEFASSWTVEEETPLMLTYRSGKRSQLGTLTSTASR